MRSNSGKSQRTRKLKWNNRSLPPPMRQDASLGKASNWVDTSKPPPPSTAFGGGVRAWR